MSNAFPRVHIHSYECGNSPDALIAKIRMRIDWMAKNSDDTEDYFEASEDAEKMLNIMEFHYPEELQKMLAEEVTRGMPGGVPDPLP